MIVFSFLCLFGTLTFLGKGQEIELGSEIESEEVDEGSNGCLVFAFTAVSVGVSMSWASSRVAPNVDVSLVLILTGLSYGYITDSASLIGFIGELSAYLGPPSMLVGMLELDTDTAAHLAPQYVLMSFPGMLMILFTNWIVLRYCMISSGFLNVFALAGLGASLSQPNFSPTKTIMRVTGMSDRLGLVCRGEVMFASILPSIIMDLVDSRMAFDFIGVSKIGYGFIDILAQLFQTSIAPICVGLGVGAIALIGLQLISNKHAPIEKQLQLFLTLICAYAAFSLSQLGVGKGGSLSIFASGWVLAWRMWPNVIARDELLNFWKTIAFFCDSLLNFALGVVLATILKSQSISNKTAYDMIHLVISVLFVWIGLSFVRVAVFFLCTPIINSFGKPFSVAEIILWGWLGTTKGKLGVTLIIFKAVEFLPKITENGANKEYAELLIIYGTGVTLITLAVNAPLTLPIIRMLGLRPDHEQEKRLKNSLGAWLIRKGIEASGIETGNKQMRLSCPFVWGQITSEAEIYKLDDIPFSTYEECLRSLLLNQVQVRYSKWCEGRSSKIVQIISASLLESTKHAKERLSSPLRDWRFILANLPRRTKEVIFIIQIFLRAQRLAQGVIDSILLAHLKSATDDIRFVRNWSDAWVLVRLESNRNCRKARSLLSELDPQDAKNSLETLETIEMCATVEESARLYHELGLIESLTSLYEALEKDYLSLDDLVKDQGERISGILVDNAMSVADELSQDDNQTIDSIFLRSADIATIPITNDESESLR